MREVANVVSAAGYPDAQVQKFTNESVGGSGYQISTKTLQPKKVKTVEQALASKFENAGQTGIKDFSATSIGPTFGKTVANSAVIAIIASLLVISAYIALRFEWKYAVPVLIALMHDLLITSGVYALVGREVTTATVAALLTILGYSLYDTIIVFDRVRENVPRMPRAAFSQILNRSMSEVLTRSLATSFCTLLPVISLFIFGGRTLKDFAFALIVGIASGAYSSIFIASPLLMTISYGGMRVIESGLDTNDWVVTEGVQRAFPGAKVDPQHTQLASAEPAPASSEKANAPNPGQK